MEELESGVVVEEAASTAMLQRIQLRLPNEMVEMIDRAIETGLGDNRSDVIRRVLVAFQNMGSASREQMAFFMAHLLSEPLELSIWLRDRANLMGMDAEARRREAGLVTIMIKEAARTAGMLEGLDLGEIRERVFRTMSSFEGFGSASEAVVESPQAKGPSVGKGFEVFISHLSERIKLGACAEEVADLVALLIHLAGGYDYYDAEGVDGALGQMAEAADIQDFRPGRDEEMDVDAFESAYQNFYLVLPVLCDNFRLRDEVRLRLLKDLLGFSGQPIEEAERLLSENASVEGVEEQEE